MLVLQYTLCVCTIIMLIQIHVQVLQKAKILLICSTA